MDQSSITLLDPMCDFANLNSEPPAAWNQWCFPGEPNFHASYPVHGSNSHHGSVDMGQYISSLIQDSHSNFFPAHNFMPQQPTPSSDLTHQGPSSRLSESPIHHSPIQGELKKQEASHARNLSVSSSSRRNSTRKHQARRVSIRELNMNAQDCEEQLESLPSAFDTEAKKKKRESNRRAAIKVRSKKRVLEEDLETTEKYMEKTNRELTAQVKGLTDQIHTLKMQLLQHVTCDCVLIQEYITGEANRYIQDISGESVNNARGS
ncbi:hypothetical protein NW768_004873 [Fusarium equiseti]|uniref:BZIP domain-containing protein n=1 Tax=Fusarium equiseti TaxID=61235 RepID=A0ABQ8RHD6_FUSEQ|nr:hypothetical protein NW768_004873 [Fusarium equiseti]